MGLKQSMRDPYQFVSLTSLILSKWWRLKVKSSMSLTAQVEAMNKLLKVLDPPHGILLPHYFSNFLQNVLFVFFEVLPVFPVLPEVFF